MVYSRLVNFLPSLFLTIVLQNLFILPSSNIKAFAAKLTGWSISKGGVLDLDMSKNVRIKPSSFKNNPKGKGIWVDFHGIHLCPKHIRGYGPIMAVRISRINRRTSRLVIDLFPTVKINTRRLRLNNFSRNRWKLILAGLPMRKFNTLKGLSIKWNPPLVDLQPKIKKKKQIIIDPGHGGQDPGAIGLNDLRETDVVLSLCLRVAALLQAQGFQTVLTRSSETSVDLFRRASVANNLEANLFVSIHANAVSSVRGDINGIETFYCEDGLSFRLAKEIQQFILKASPKSISRGVRNGHFFVIRNTLMSSVLVETGFLTGSLDSIRLATYEYRERVALAIATGILNYIKKES